MVLLARHRTRDPYLPQHHDDAIGMEEAGGVSLVQAQSRFHGPPGPSPKILHRRCLGTSNNLAPQSRGGACVNGAAPLQTLTETGSGVGGKGEFPAAW